MRYIILTLTLLFSLSSFGQSVTNLNSEINIKIWIDNNSKDKIEGIWVFSSINPNTDEQSVYLKAAILRSGKQSSERESFQEIMIECYGPFADYCKKNNWDIGDFLASFEKVYNYGLYYSFGDNGEQNGVAVLEEDNLSIDYQGLLVSAKRVYPLVK